MRTTRSTRPSSKWRHLEPRYEPTMDEAPAPTVATDAIRSYHAHVYFTTPDERATALALRGPIGERFVVTLGRVHDR